MSEAYAVHDQPGTVIHSRPVWFQPQTIYESLTGMRDQTQRTRMFAADVPNYRLDPALRGGRVIHVCGDVRGPIGWLSMVVELHDGTCRAVTVEIDRRCYRPVRSAVVLTPTGPR